MEGIKYGGEVFVIDKTGKQMKLGSLQDIEIELGIPTVAELRKAHAIIQAEKKWKRYCYAELAKYWTLFYDVKSRIRARSNFISIRHTYSHDSTICKHHGQIYKVGIDRGEAEIKCRSCGKTFTVGKDGRLHE